MDEGIDDTSDLYNDAYTDDATGKNSALQNVTGALIDSKRQQAASGLRAAESSAAKSASGAASGAGAAASKAAGAAGPAGIAAAKAAEAASAKKQNGLFTGNGKDATPKKSKFNLKKSLPIIAILLILILAIGGISFIGQSFQLFSLTEQTKIDNKLSATVYTRASEEIISRLESTDPDRTISKYLQDLFKENGFDYIENYNSDGTISRALVYSGNDNSTLLAGQNIKDSIMNTLSSTGSVVNNYREISSVPTGQDEVAAAWYSTVSTVSTAVWYDDDAEMTYNRLGLNPGKFNTGNANPSKEDIVEAAKSGAATEDINPVSGTVNCMLITKNEDGTTDSRPEPCVSNTETRITTESDLAAVTQALQTRASMAAYSTKPSDNNTEAKAKSEESIKAAVTTMVKNKATNFAYDIVNATDKAKAGDGGVEMSYYANLLNTPAKSYDAKGNLVSDVAATSTDSFNSWFSDNIKVDPNNPVVKKYNVSKTLEEDFNYSANNITSDVAGNYNKIDNTGANSKISEKMENADDYMYCHPASDVCNNYVNLNSSNMANISPDVAKYVHQMTSIDLSSDPAGQDAAVAFNEGIALLDDAMLKQSSGTYGGEEASINFYRMTKEYNDQLANYDRHTKSPLDISSSNTFLGSIVSSLLPLATKTQNNALFSSITAGSTIVASSISSLLPKAAADSVNELDYKNRALSTDCEAYKASGMLCDVSGNPNVIMDTRYMAEGQNMKDMSQIEQEMKSKGQITCTSDNSCEPTDSDNSYSYKNWMICTQNDTTVNNSLANQTGAVKVGFFKSVVNAIAGWFGLGEKVRNQTICGGNYYGDTTAESSFPLYAQYTLDQRIKVAMGDIEESTSTAYLKKYYAENPLDNSYEGIIARQSGLTIAEVKQVFADIEYAVYIANYHPDARYYFIEPRPSKLELAIEQTKLDQFKTAAIVGKMQDYEELKSRNFAA